MARIDTLNNFCTDVADSIREMTGKTEPILASNFDTEIKSIQGSSEPNLQDKSIMITENKTTNITADDGYDGLANVEVTTNIPSSSGELPEKGFVVNEWGNDGYVTEITVIGLETLPEAAFGSTYSNSSGMFVYPLMNGKLETVNLPSTITTIPARCFYYCWYLKNINLSNITSIGIEAFVTCKALSLTELPDSITSIGEAAFSGCTNLALTKLPLNLTKINNNVFKDCTNLALTNLPDGITSIGTSAFYGCKNLKLEELPNNLTSIGQYAFGSCTNLPLTKLSDNLTTISQRAFQDCTNLAIKTIPDGVTNINMYTFQYCTSLIQMSMNNVTSIYGGSTSYSAFRDCTGLKAVWIGSAITNSGLYRYSFYNCTGLTKIYIDLPRATVEAFTNYTYGFRNVTNGYNIIVCNDDEGFMTKEEFDSIDWSTYTE